MSVSCQNNDGLLLLLQAARTLDEERPSHRSTYSDTWELRPSQRNCCDRKYAIHNDIGYSASRRPVTATRCTHNELEKSRRAHLRACMETLKKHLAFDNDVSRITMLTVLKKATSTIKYIRQRNQHLESVEENEKQRSAKLMKKRLFLKKKLEEKRNKSLKFWKERNRNCSECSINTTSSEDSEIDAHLRNGMRSDLTASHGPSSPNRQGAIGTTTYVLNGFKRASPLGSTSRPPSGLDTFDASSSDSGFEELHMGSQSASPDDRSMVYCTTLADLRASRNM